MHRTLVIVGAGPGLGMGVARAFGKRGYRVGLIARDAERLAASVGELGGLGITAAARPADVADHSALAGALDGLRGELGEIDVLEYSPGPQGAPITSAAETTPESAAAQFALSTLGGVAAVGHVLPAMLRRGSGTLLLTTGVSSKVPAPFLGNVGLAMAGLRNWARALHLELAPKGVHAAAVVIATGITADNADEIGERYAELAERPDRAEEVIGDVAAFEELVRSAAAVR
ncbi:Short-chain dehydrogenase [Saccharopolyspora antimicrobica]|uniref:Short-chain dehydrogenase n=1 Tax=Saccharopolyspora antimicrobica TaxID=455193 RepID=A0A1I5M8T1_9PSEU|nr:SDR family NAD(P)-dependent oxidoreductase [Saccharopolyspora antimicrobica]RKT82080.1 short-subunit dehydrogenase [Saccharopolyspora antimicrobica]SFP05421.1 Short-chain dehydrogenase [Saccharopolyspora antimicrobica]